MSRSPRSPLTAKRRGSVQFGHLATAPGPIVAADHDLRSPMGGFVTDAERDAAFRSFQFIGAIGDRFAVGCAITSTAAGMSAFAYAWRDGEFTELRLASRPSDTAAFAADPDDGTTEIDTARGSVRMTATGAGKHLVVEAENLGIDLSFTDDDVNILRLCTPTGPTGWAYVQKVAGPIATGEVRAAGRSTTLADHGALAHHDYTTGFLRPETWWHWACIAARLEDGRRLGLNLSCGTNESGWRENGGWLDGRWFPLDGAIFDFDRDDTEQPWRVTANDGRFELRFTPHHGYHALHDSPALSTNFHQLFGGFDGWLTADTGERLEIVDLGGFAESQFLRW